MPEPLSDVDSIRRAYLEPIRTAILIDDAFPMYSQLCESIDEFKTKDPVSESTSNPSDKPSLKVGIDPKSQPDTPGNPSQPDTPSKPRPRPWDAGRARALWQACRGRGWACDIDNGAPGAGATTHIEKSDLVVLDYHLNPTDPVDPSRAHEILGRIAAGDHSTLVVVYTRDDRLKLVRRQVAAHLRGARRPDEMLAGATLEAWDELEEWTPEVPESILDAFLAGDRKAWGGDTVLRRDLDARNVPQGLRVQLIEAKLESLVGRNLFAPRIADSAAPSIEMNRPDEGRLWIKHRNLFVTFVHKTGGVEMAGAEVIAALENALLDWGPKYLALVLSYARSVIARGGFLSELEALRQPILQAGWLYHALSGPEHEQRARVEGLFERLLSSYTNRLVRDIAEVGEAMFPPSPGEATELASRVRILAGLPETVPPWHIVHSLNEFLALERPPFKVVNTGTIFRRDGQAGDKTYWICVTPACDLVPREPRKETWENELHPVRSILAIRARNAASVEAAMGEAEECRHVFLEIDSKPTAIQVIDRTNPLPRMEPFLLDHMGQIEDGRFSARRLLKSDDGNVQLTAMTMEVVGQLREIYANRLLQQAGHHLSRIGVDFVNLPVPKQSG